MSDRYRRVLRLTRAQYGLLLHCVTDQITRDDGIQVYHAFAPREDCTPSELLRIVIDAPVEEEEGG